MATIKDVCAYTGLALGTVSKYINGLNVRPENKHLLDEAVLTLGYRVNHAARNLKQSRTNTIGVMISVAATSQYADMLSSLEEALQAGGYACTIISCPPEHARICQKIQKLIGTVDGIMLICNSVTAAELHNACGELPIILINHAIPYFLCDTILVDYRRAAQKAVTHLLELRHERIGLVAGRVSAAIESDPCASYLSALSERQLSIDPSLLAEGDDSFQFGYQAFHRLMHNSNPPTAILTTSYLLTIGAIAAAYERGISLEKDIGFVGFNGSGLSRLNSMSLTLVEQSLDLIGEAASKLMLLRLNGNRENYPAMMRFDAELHTHLVG